MRNGSPVTITVGAATLLSVERRRGLGALPALGAARRPGRRGLGDLLGRRLVVHAARRHDRVRRRPARRRHAARQSPAARDAHRRRPSDDLPRRDVHPAGHDRQTSCTGSSPARSTATSSRSSAPAPAECRSSGWCCLGGNTLALPAARHLRAGPRRHRVRPHRVRRRARRARPRPARHSPSPSRSWAPPPTSSTPADDPTTTADGRVRDQAARRRDPLGRDLLNALKYLEIRFRGSSGFGIDHSTINGDEIEFRDAAGNLIALAAPVRVGTSDIYRYAFTATLAAGTYTVTFLAGRFADLGGRLNSAETERFTVTAPTVGAHRPDSRLRRSTSRTSPAAAGSTSPSPSSPASTINPTSHHRRGRRDHDHHRRTAPSSR